MVVAVLALCAGAHSDASSIAVLVASNPGAFSTQADGAHAARSWLSRLSTATRAQVRRDGVRANGLQRPIDAFDPVAAAPSADLRWSAPLCLDRPWLLALPPPVA